MRGTFFVCLFFSLKCYIRHTVQIMLSSQHTVGCFCECHQINKLIWEERESEGNWWKYIKKEEKIDWNRKIDIEKGNPFYPTAFKIQTRLSLPHTNLATAKGRKISLINCWLQESRIAEQRILKSQKCLFFCWVEGIETVNLTNSFSLIFTFGAPRE